MRRLLSLLILAALAGCSDRERSNPFDPSNPNTHGGPAGFVALADDGRVELSWSAVTGTALSGFRLFRRTTTDTTYRAITGLLAPTTTHYSDVGLLNGLDHSYRLVYVFPDQVDRGTAAEDIATPGPARPWVVATGTGQVLRLTPDARHVAYALGGFDYPSSVATDPVSGWVWTSDNFGGRVVILNPWNGTMVTITALTSPSTLTVDPSDHSAWVCEETAGRLDHFSLSGAQLGGGPIEPIDTPIGVSVDPVDGSVWVAERGAGRLRHYAASQALLGTATVDRPSRVAVDSVTQAVWVASFESRQVFRVTAGVVDKTVPGFVGPIGIAVDSRRGRVWVADALGDQVLLLDRQGVTLARITGIAEARDISVNARTGEAWVVAPASGEVVLLSSAGKVIRRLRGLDHPVGISVDPGIRDLPTP